VSASGGTPDALITASTRSWSRIAGDLSDGMEEYRNGRLRVRFNLNLVIGFLAATSGRRDPERLRAVRVETEEGHISTLQAGSGPPVVMLHGLGGTKASFIPTVAALAPSYRTIAMDLPGFGDSTKPIGAAYHAPFFARSVVALMDSLGLSEAHFIGHSMGGRVALEMGFRHGERTAGLVLMTPSMAWLRERRWASALRLVRPELGLLQPVSRRGVEAVVKRLVPGAENTWVTVAVDEFLRSYMAPRGRAAFYAAARQIYLEDPNRFWNRLETLAPESLFIWGSQDRLVPPAFRHHVERRLPAASHVVLRCGHVPQLERPHELHAAIGRHLEGLTSMPMSA